MNITITTDHGCLQLTKATATLKDETRDALGRDRCSFSCQEDKAKVWPLGFELTLTGHFESRKEGRLSASITIRGSWPKGAKAPEMEDRIHVSLTRESVCTALGGWVQQDAVAAMVREKLNASTQILPAAKDALCTSMAAIAAKEDERAQAHMDRAAAARGAMNTLRKK